MVAKAKNKGKKVPQSAAPKASAAGKHPKISPDYHSPNAMTPVWCIGCLQEQGDFGWRSIDANQFWGEILPKLQGFEGQKWGEILNRNNHSVEIGKLAKEAQKELKRLKLDDIDELVSLRLTGRQRVWGMRKEREFHILWWDPDHKVYPSAKKNT